MRQTTKDRSNNAMEEYPFHKERNRIPVAQDCSCSGTVRISGAKGGETLTELRTGGY